MVKLRFYKLISVMVFVSLLSSLLVFPAGAQESPYADFDLSYSDRALEVIEVHIVDQVINPDGSVTGNVSLEAKSAITYGLAFEESGLISGPVIEKYLNIDDVSVPYVGKRSLPLGSITMDPGESLTFRLNKYGAYDDEFMYIFFFDICTFITLYSGFGYLPTTTAEGFEGLKQAVLPLVHLLKNAGFDGVVLIEQLRTGDWNGAGQTIGHMMTIIPDAFSNFFKTEYGLTISSASIAKIGNILDKGLPLVGTIPVVRDLIRRPEEVEVTLKVVGQTGSDVDVMLVIDRSGSMYGTKIQDAKNSAKLFVDLMGEGDQLGVVSFSNSATIDYGLTEINSSTKESIKQTIDDIYASGMTSIGAGLQLAQQELSDQGYSNRSHAIVLLSNGGENMPPYVDAILPSVLEAGTRGYTIGLGSDANEQILQEIAHQTGGTYTFAPNSGDLALLYNLLSGQVSGQQTVTSGSSSVAPGSTGSQFAFIGTREAVFSISWADQSVDLDLTLISPSGDSIDPTTADTNPSIEYIEATGYELFKIFLPETGLWTMEIHNPSTSSEVTYSYVVSEDTDLKLEVFSSVFDAYPSEPVQISAMIYDNQGAIIGAEVTAEVIPSGSSINLFDDGAHGDGEANDGIYSSVYLDTSSIGNYSFFIEASGQTAGGEEFSREANLSVRVLNEIQPIADLGVLKFGPSNFSEGDQITYEILFGNYGPHGVNNIYIEDILPANTTYASSSLPPTSSSTPGKVTWIIDSLGSYEYGSIFVTIETEIPNPPMVYITNYATISAPSVSDLVPGNNTGMVSTEYLILLNIDIKPESDPNSILLENRGVVPVGVFGSEDFNVTLLDPSTVEFANTNPLRWAYEDLDFDGILDMIFHFKTKELDLNESSTSAYLTGMTLDGIQIQGEDTVRILGD